MKTYSTTEEEINFLKESPTMYVSAGQSISLNGLTPLQKMAIGKQGITKTYLELFKKSSALDYSELASALSVTRATLLNKKGSQRFSEQLSERIVLLADLYAFGYDIFKDKDAFNHWMQAPNQALGGITPLSITDSLYGREEVKNVIGRIAYGVFS